MTDSCFVCLCPSRSSVCTRCTVRCHPTCWATFLAGEHTNSGFNALGQRYVSCPQCKEIIVTNSHNTRLSAEATRMRTIFIRTVKAGLKAVAESTDEAHRKHLSGEMFEYICQNMAVVIQCHRFIRIMERKLRKLYIIDEWEEASGYYTRLFGRGIQEEIMR
jgi:hypothetical protein